LKYEPYTEPRDKEEMLHVRIYKYKVIVSKNMQKVYCELQPLNTVDIDECLYRL